VGLTQVKVSSDEYSTGHKRVEIVSGETAYTEMNVSLWTIHSLNDTTVTDGGEVLVSEWDPDEGDHVNIFGMTLPPSGIVDADGAVYTESVELRLAMLDTPAEVAAAPGDMMAVDTDDPSAEVSLESFGMFEAQLLSESGEPL
jgi:hypothetical protein